MQFEILNTFHDKILSFFNVMIYPLLYMFPNQNLMENLNFNLSMQIKV